MHLETVKCSDTHREAGESKGHKRGERLHVMTTWNQKRAKEANDGEVWRFSPSARESIET